MAFGFDIFYRYFVLSAWLLLVIINRKGFSDQGPHCLTARAIVLKSKCSDFSDRLISTRVIQKKKYLFIYLHCMLYLAITLGTIVGYTVELQELLLNNSL